MSHQQSEQSKLIHVLTDSFSEYHANSADQARWLQELVTAVRRDERERCAELADAAGHTALATGIRRG